MRLFCLLWLPLLYLFWSGLLPERSTGKSGIVALILGSIVGLVMFFFGSLTEPGGFGLSRWVSGFVDMIAPAVLPFVVYMALFPIKAFRESNNFGAFGLLWLIPDMGIRLAVWGVQQNPLLLVLVPVLRSAVVIGISFFLSCILTKNPLKAIPGVLGIILLPFTATTSYWAFFSHIPIWGWLFLVITVLPGTVAMLVMFFRQLR